MIKYAKLAAIHDDITAMDKGYDTQVGYSGRNLSGGQKARVALARALMTKKRILLLDEATAALDNATEARVQEGIAQALKENPMTVVSIAHRLTTIRHADKIMLLDAGVVLEEGSHEDLIARNGEYKKRWDLFMAGQNSQ
jgi:ABC-type multidrug transport system fused ATPase/permease subunit